MGIADAGGTLREKRLTVDVAACAFERGWSFIDAIDYWDAGDAISTDAGATHAEAVVDTSSGRPWPFGPRAAAFMAEFTGQNAHRSGRHQLRRIVARLARFGLTARVGWEFECIVLDQTAALVPAMAANRCWSALTPAIHAEMFDGLAATLGAGGVPVHHLCCELGPGCLEIALDACDPLRSADDAVAAKLFTKAFFARRGQAATFMAQLDDTFPGLGGHPSVSLWDETGSPVLAGDQAHDLSKTAGSAIGGIVGFLPELLVMAAHTVNAYRRFAPGNWAPRTASWGPGNYTTALRVAGGGADETRLEFRIPGADTAPHLCLAMLLGAVVLGLEQAMDPPDAIVPPRNARDLSPPVVGLLPRNLLEATGRFERSEAAMELFGPAFVEHFSQCRYAEDSTCRRFVSPQERDRYLHQV